MFNKLAVSFVAAGLAIASASTHTIQLFEESIVSGQSLKPGEYTLKVNGDKAVLSRGKTKVEAPIAVENSDARFGSTSVRYLNGDGKFRVKEIRLGGTKTKLVFDTDAAPVAAGGGR
jgi:hypothetical protein